LAVGDPFVSTPNSIPNILEQFLASKLCERRIGSSMVSKLHTLVWSHAAELREFDEQSQLVHSDFGSRNLLVREVSGTWVIAAVLDWEFGFSGPPLLDVGHFLRYEPFETQLREPHFSRGFLESGGTLPENWRQLARLIDLTGLVETLSHHDLPAAIEKEVIELIVAASDNSDRMPHRFNSE
jgi:aminoglycoside phosphotransferase (APT) family kinase protein